MNFDKLFLNFERALGVAGVGVIGWMVYRLGPGRVATNLHAVNWGFFLMAAMKGCRYVFQTAAWRMILGREGRAIGFWRLFKANLQGEALNYITVTRMGGEPLKVLSIKKRVSLAESAASVIVLKYSVIFGFWLTVAGGSLAVLLNSDVAGEVKTRAVLALFLVSAFLAFISWVQSRGMFSSLSWVLRQYQSKRAWISEHVLRLTRLDNQILETYRSRPWRVAAAAGLNALGWVEEIAFIAVALHFLGMGEGWFLPTLIGTIALLANSVFFFVPWRAGTQEGTMVLAFTLLRLSEPAGLSVAILRRMRELVWIFAGLILFALESLPSQSSGPATAQSGIS